MVNIIGLKIHCLVFVLFGVFHLCQNISPFHQTFALGTDSSQQQQSTYGRAYSSAHRTEF